ncbi:hypothetical protein FEM48_Zijuj11G0151500 [Ziziphus jujuba var. spinosa]|uniref:Uncharacterized protein n=1 Tax=Ziziphus jujuba var. spinosa TaxID=714518 RepID=A0A978UJN5_ZIZJJ|nr:hypothetical protein FEM48_Zijuj11G0151500 [Ziziphus jujuba var. spinosa]
MVLNVFGKPIGNETLKAMPKYQDKEVITAVNRAYEALIMKNADDKGVNAREFVESLKKSMGILGIVHTRCCSKMVNGVHFFMSISLHVVGPLQLPYMAVRMRIEMLLTGCCPRTIHTKTTTASILKSERIDWSSIHDNDLRMLTKFDHHYSSATLNGCYSTVITGYSDVIYSGDRICPIFEGIMTLENAWIQ